MINVFAAEHAMIIEIDARRLAFSRYLFSDPQMPREVMVEIIEGYPENKSAKGEKKCAFEPEIKIEDAFYRHLSEKKKIQRLTL